MRPKTAFGNGILKQIRFFSHHWCEIVGYSFDDPELPHTYESWKSRIHPDDRDLVDIARKNHLEKGIKYNVEYRHRHKSGEYRWHNSIGQTVFDKDGKPIKMVGCSRDITQRKQMEEKLKEMSTAKKILGSFTEPFVINCHQLTLSISIGIAIYWTNPIK